MGGVGNEEGLFRGKAGNEEVEERWWRRRCFSLLELSIAVRE